jgi:hypothetical protein
MPKGKGKSAHVSLTQSRCSRIKPAKGGIFDYYDTRLANLSLRASPPSQHHRGGLLTWRFGYRRAGKAGIVTLGRFPEWSADAALHQARALQVAVDRGQDPAELLRPRQAPAPVATALPPADTARAMFRRYEPTLDEKSDAHRRVVTSYFDRYVLPAWGDRDIHTIKKREIADLLKTVKGKSGPVAANRCATAISAWFNFLITDGVLDASPATKLPRSEERPREQTLTVDQLVRVWQAAERIGGPNGKFVQLLIALPVRRDEAAELPRVEVDIAKQEWLLPGGRNKSGRDFLLPLNTLAKDILAACPNTGPFFFSTSGRHPISGFTRLKAKLDAEIAKLPGEPLPKWVFHDVRRSLRSALSELKVDRIVCEKVLNHAPPKLERTYDRYSYAAEKRQALQLWADHFAAVMAASSTAEPETRAAAD